MSAPPISIVIPAYNESAIIVEHADAVSAWLAENGFEAHEVLVVDDGSTDGMDAVLQDAASTRPWLRTIRHARNAGRGQGVRTGFEHSVGDYVVCLDADLSYAPPHIGLLLAPLMANEADVTLASAYHPEGRVENVPFQRAVLSRLGNWVLSRGLEGDIHTATCIVRGYRREVIDSLELFSTDKDLHLEILQKCQLLGFRIREAPAVLAWRDRDRGRGRGWMPEIAIVRMRRTVLSHLVFNYLSNPGVLLLLPIVSLLAIVLAGSAMLVTALIENLSTLDAPFLQVLRQTLLDGRLSLAIVLFGTISLAIFVVFYFLSAQSKRYFDETYTLMMRMNRRIKRLEDASREKP